MSLGERLQRLRKERGLSQDTVAKKLFVSRQSVSKWETDKAEPGVESLKALAGLYGVTVDSLLGVEEKPPEESSGLGAYQRLLLFRLAATAVALLGMMVMDDFFVLWTGASICLLPGALVMLLGCGTKRMWNWWLLVTLEVGAVMLLPLFCPNQFAGVLAILLGGGWVFRLCQDDIQALFH